MSRIATLALVAALSFAACSSAAAPTPQVIYVTPVPSVAPSPVATASATPTGDDAKISALITGTVTRLKGLGVDMGSGGSLLGMVTVLPELSALFASARAQLNLYRSSSCLSLATAYFRTGLNKSYDGIGQLMNAWQSGTLPPSDIRGVLGEGFASLSSAWTLAESTTCP